MADPVSLGAMSMGGTILGGIVKGVGDIFGSQAQAKQYQYQAAVARINQQIASQNAAYAIAVGEVKAQQAGMRTAATIGTTLAKQASSGIDVNTGSPVRVRASEADLGAEDVATIRWNAEKEAYNQKVKGVMAKAEAGAYDAAASNTKTAGYISAVGSFLGTATSVSDKWLKFGQQGVPGFGDPGASNPLLMDSSSNFSSVSR